MSNPNFADEEEEKPLDPAMEKVRRKMVRLLFISSSAIVLALMTVLGSIVYKANRNSTASTVSADRAAPAEAIPAARQEIVLPAGFTIDSTSLSGNRLLLSGKMADGSRKIIIQDIGTGKPLTEIDVKPAQP
ncbi:MAG: hypothetical protein RLZZ444_2258 [Pseudomonadota bacterium]|jgi:hypothetical protein